MDGDGFFEKPDNLPFKLSDRLKIGRSAWNERNLQLISNWRFLNPEKREIFEQLNIAALTAFQKMSEKRRIALKRKYNLQSEVDIYQRVLLFFLPNTPKLKPEQLQFLTYANDSDGEIRDIYKTAEHVENTRIEWCNRQTRTQLTDEEVNSLRKNPYYGMFQIYPTNLAGLKDWLDFKKSRLIITGRGIWLSLLYDKGIIGVGYWSPSLNNLDYCFGVGMGSLVALVLAGLFYDSLLVKEKIFSADLKQNEFVVRLKNKERVIYIPRVRYSPSDQKRWKVFSSRRDFDRKAHLRNLPDGHNASVEAIKNAIEFGWFPPSDGQTFVRPHDGDDVAPLPRLVCKGLEIALVGLRKWNTNKK